MQFIERLDKTRDVDIYGLDENEYVDEVSFDVEWTAELETRDWGIKACYISLVNITGTYTTSNWQTDKITEHVFDFSDYKDNAEIELTWTDRDSLMVTNLEFDVQAKTLEVS